MFFLTNRAPQENSRDILALVGMFLLNSYHILRDPAMCKMGDSRVGALVMGLGVRSFNLRSLEVPVEFACEEFAALGCKGLEFNVEGCSILRVRGFSRAAGTCHRGTPVLAKFRVSRFRGLGFKGFRV